MLGAKPAASLPVHTLATIARQDASSEVLVRIIQLAIVMFFGALFAISPKTDGGTAFSPVPTIFPTPGLLVKASDAPLSTVTATGMGPAAR